MPNLARSVASRTILLSLSLAGAYGLTGCQSASTDKPAPAKSATAQSATEKAAYDKFLAEFQPAVVRHLLATNRQGAVGAKNLRIKFDRTNEMLSCAAESAKAPWVLSSPSMSQRRDSGSLARLVNQECWKIIYPVIPDHFFGPDGTADIVVPLIFGPVPVAAAASQRQRLQYQAQSDYFWQQLLVNRAVDSIGIAGFRFQANTQGQVEGCLVSLDPAPVRRDAFKFDNALQEQLTRQCKTLDLRQMPGFLPDENGRVQGYVEVAYAPGKVGRE